METAVSPVEATLNELDSAFEYRGIVNQRNSNIMITSLEDSLHSLLKAEEEQIIKVLESCSVATVKHDVVMMEFKHYLDYEPPFNIPGYIYTGVDTNEPKKPKKRKSTRPAPFTIYKTHYFTNESTGNEMELIESSRPYYDEQHRQYHVLRARFHSDKQNITKPEIQQVLDFIYNHYLGRVHQYRKENPTPWSFYYRHDPMPWHLYAVEPCIDFEGTKEAIDWLHRSLVPNVWITRYSKRFTYRKGIRTKKTEDGRELYGDTYYISKRLKCYKYTTNKKQNYFCRFEFNINKDYLRTRDIWLLSEYPDNLAHEFWNNHCNFFTINIPKIMRKVNRNDFIWFFSQPGIDLLMWLREKKIYNSSKDLITTKWLTLHRLISDSFAQLNMDKQEIINNILITPVTILTKHDNIVSVIEKLTQQRIKITNKAISKQTGYSISTVKRHK